MKLYWLSWYQNTEDFRPLSFPPNPAVMGWWCSGQDAHTGHWSLCAMVHVESIEAARDAILLDWPEARESGWRFFDEKPLSWRPNDRFPPSPWMTERWAALPEG